MVAEIIDCKAIAQECDAATKTHYDSLDRIISFATIITGPPSIIENGHRINTKQKPSWIYAAELARECAMLGIEFRIIRCYTDKRLIEETTELNKDERTSGALILAPHPREEGKITLSNHDISNLLDARIDVEGMSHLHKGLLVQDYRPHMVAPPTAVAVMEILHHYDFQFTYVTRDAPDAEERKYSRKAVIINRSEVVGLPLRSMLEHYGMFVVATDVHTHPDIIATELSDADLVVTAVPSDPRRPEFKLNPQLIKEGAFVVAVNSRNISNTPQIKYHDGFMARASYLTHGTNNIGQITSKLTIQNLLTLNDPTHPIFYSYHKYV